MEIYAKKVKIKTYIKEDEPMIDFNKLTTQAQNTILASQDTMRRYQNNQLEPLHLLLTALEDNKTVIHDILKELKINSDNLREDVQTAINNLPKISYTQNNDQIYISSNFNNLYNKATEIAESMKDSFVSL